jgi:hypothetical protein
VVIPANAVVWEQRIMKTGPPQPFFGFYIKRWNNPIPEEPVETIGFEPAAYSGAFLVAITIRLADDN